MSDILTGLFGFNAIQKAEKIAENDITRWITVRGAKVPIRSGQSESDAVKGFLEKKSGSKKTDSSKSPKGRYGTNQSSKILDELDARYGRKPKKNRYTEDEMVQREVPDNVTKEEGKKWYAELSKKHKITKDQKIMYNEWLDDLSDDKDTSTNSKKTDSTYDRAVSKVDAFGKKNRASGKPMVGSKEANKESDARKRKEDDAFISNDKKYNAKKTESGSKKTRESLIAEHDKKPKEYREAYHKLFNKYNSDQDSNSRTLTDKYDKKYYQQVDKDHADLAKKHGVSDSHKDILSLKEYEKDGSKKYNHSDSYKQTTSKVPSDEEVDKKATKFYLDRQQEAINESKKKMKKSIQDMNNATMEKSIKDMKDAVAVLDHTPQLEKSISTLNKTFEKSMQVKDVLDHKKSTNKIEVKTDNMGIIVGSELAKSIYTLESNYNGEIVGITHTNL